VAYNGHESWNAWNVSLWINNEEGLYSIAKDCIWRADTRNEAAEQMLEILQVMGVDKTPDGAPYTKTSIRLAMREM
jgi:hypothetical protein